MNRWDKYFLDLCGTVSSNSKCLSRQIGAILVQDRIVVTTGYNGPPRGVPHCKEVCPRTALEYQSGEGLFLCPGAHAEKNCIASAARLGVSTLGTTLYLNTGVPCKDCMAMLINAGVVEVVCTELTYYDTLTQWMVEHSGIKVRTFK